MSAFAHFYRYITRATIALVLASLLLTVMCPAGRPQAANVPPLVTRSAQVEIRISENAAADVQERFVFGAPLANTGFEYLSEPCATVDSLKITNGGGEPVAFSQQQNGPWTLLTPTSPPSAVSDFRVDFAVRLGGAVPRIPIVMPSRALQFSGKDGAVTVRVVVDPSAGGGAIVIPQLTQEARPGLWVGSLAALPSFVRMRLEGHSLPPPCTGPAVSGSTGSLPLWIAGFAGILTVWVIFYMWWAERQERPVRG